MKSTLLILMVTLHLMVATLAVGEGDSDGIALTVVIDSRWSCGNDMPEFRTLARQGIGALQLGDCVEILTAHPSRPRIRLAQTARRSSPSQMHSVNSVLSRIHVGFLSDAKVSRALAMALDRLERICSTQGYQKAIVIVLSDGHLADSDVASVLKLAAEFRKRGWPLYITGDRNTNRNLLIAANRRMINWSSIGDANPALWLQQARISGQPEPKNRPSGERPQETKMAPLAAAAETPSTLGETPLRTVPRPSYFAPEWPERNSAARGPRQPQDITTRSRTEVEVTFSGGSSPASAARPDESSSEEEVAVALSIPEEPNQAPEMLKGVRTDKEETDSKSKPPMWGQVKRWLGRFWPWLLIGLCALPIMAVGYTFVRGSRRAEEIRRILQGYVRKPKTSNDGMLVVTINGQARHLGRLSRLRPIYIGSGVKNTIRVVEKGIGDRHLCLYQKAGKLMVRNLSKNPVTLRGLAIEPKAKQAVALPTVIDLTERVKVRLSLQQNGTDSTIQRSENHAQNKQ